MDNVKNALARTKKFVSDHQVAIAIGVATVATATVCIMIQRSAIKDWNNFLTEQGLIDKFYSPEI